MMLLRGTAAIHHMLATICKLLVGALVMQDQHWVVLMAVLQCGAGCLSTPPVNLLFLVMPSVFQTGDQSEFYQLCCLELCNLARQ